MNKEYIETLWSKSPKLTQHNLMPHMVFVKTVEQAMKDQREACLKSFQNALEHPELMRAGSAVNIVYTSILNAEVKI